MNIIILDTAHIAHNKKPMCNHPKLQKIKGVVRPWMGEILCGNCVVKAYKHGYVDLLPKPRP